jgi:hypothetical protein
MYKRCTGKLMRKRRLGRLKDNIEMDLEEMGFGCVDWIFLALDRD